EWRDQDDVPHHPRGVPRRTKMYMRRCAPLRRASGVSSRRACGAAARATGSPGAAHHRLATPPRLWSVRGRGSGFGGRLRRQASANRVEFEDSPTLGHGHWIAEVDAVNDAEEPDTERNAARERTEDVAEVSYPLRWVQLGRGYFFRPAPHGDGRAGGGAQV